MTATVTQLRSVPTYCDTCGRAKTEKHTPAACAAVAEVKALRVPGYTKLLKKVLRERSGIAFSVTCGRGTGYGWIHISIPRSRWENGEPTPHDVAILDMLFGCSDGRVSIPSSDDYYVTYLACARGEKSPVQAERYWD